MGAIDILLTVCLLSNPTACEQKSIPVGDAGSLAQCMYWAQPHIAEWSTTHPKYKIVKWRCAYPNPDGEPI